MASLQAEVKYVGVESGKSYYTRIHDQFPALLLHNFPDEELEPLASNPNDVRDLCDSIPSIPRVQAERVGKRTLPATSPPASSTKRRKFQSKPGAQASSQRPPAGKRPRQLQRMQTSTMGKRPRPSYQPPTQTSYLPDSQTSFQAGSLEEQMQEIEEEQGRGEKGDFEFFDDKQDEFEDIIEF